MQKLFFSKVNCHSFFKKKGLGFCSNYDAIQITTNDSLQVPTITRSRAKKLKDSFNKLIQSIWTNMNFKDATISTSDDQILVNLKYMQEEFDLFKILAQLFFNGGLINFSKQF